MREKIVMLSPCRYAALVLALILVSIIPSSAWARSVAPHAAVMPVRLRIDALVEPVGLDSVRPEFSWTLKAADPKKRNLAQSGYRVLVASSAALLVLDRADIWDSGRVANAESLHAQYKGGALRSHTTYWWKMCVRDQRGIASEWSKPASWTTGLLHRSDWSAQWIAAEPDTHPPPTAEQSALAAVAPAPMPIFRRQFAIDKPVRQALIFVTGLGQYELTLNGESVTDTVMNPGWTNYRKTVLYQTYDVTKLLRHGGNCFGVLLGGGMYDVPSVAGRYSKFTGSFGQPKLILQMQLLYTDGATAQIVSDGDWRTTPGPIVFSSVYGGEDYDARKQPAGWNMPGFDDASWARVVVVAAPNGASLPQDSGLSGHAIPPMRIVRILKPAKTTEHSPGVVVYDFGENFSGWPGITVRGNASDRIKVIPGELLDSQGLVTQASADAGPGKEVLFNYTLKGGGDAEVWHPRFSPYGFRYLQVETIASSAHPDDKPALISVEGDVVHDDVERTGEFSSSLPLFDDIHRLIDGAILSNLASVLTDCPTREKLGWLEQTHLMASSIMENYDVLRLYEKLAADIGDAQLADGLVPAIAPEVVTFVDKEGRSTKFRDSPEWGSASILSLWAAYQFYGDKALLAEHYAGMKQYAQYLRDKSVGHILAYGLGDWYDVGPKEPGDSQFTSMGLTATAIYYQDLTTMQQIAGVLGESRDRSAYGREASAVKQAFNRRFFHSDTNEYDRGSQTANALPLAVGLVPAGRRTPVLEHLVADIRQHDNHVTAGDIGFHYLVRALTEEGRSDVLFDMLSRTDAPSYGYQLAAGATTLTEAWDANPKHSQNHFMLGHAEEWFYRGLVGIDLDLSRVASQRIIIHPAMLKEAQGASATMESVVGTIRVSWRYAKGWSLEVEIPPGSSATVYLPGKPSTIRESSVPLLRAGLKRPPTQFKGMTMVTIGSGIYHFADGE